MSGNTKWRSVARKIGGIIGVVVVLGSLAYYGVSICSMQEDLKLTKRELTPDISIHKVWTYSLDFRDTRDASLGLNPRTDIPLRTSTWKNMAKEGLPKSTRYIWLQLENHGGGPATITRLETGLFLWRGTKGQSNELPEQDLTLRTHDRRFLLLGYFDTSETEQDELTYIESELTITEGVLCSYTDIFSNEEIIEIPPPLVYFPPSFPPYQL